MISVLNISIKILAISNTRFLHFPLSLLIFCMVLYTTWNREGLLVCIGVYVLRNVLYFSSLSSPLYHSHLPLLHHLQPLTTKGILQTPPVLHRAEPQQLLSDSTMLQQEGLSSTKKYIRVLQSPMASSVSPLEV